MSGKVEKKRCPGVIEERLGIEVTTHCNISCSHCFARSGVSELSSLAPELVKEILTEGYNIGYRHLHITGGEPLIWKGLFDALDYAYNVGYQTVFLNTNGALLSADIASRLAAYDNLAISVSLEGTEALHDRFRGKGSYRQTVQGIEKAQEAGIVLSIFTMACKSLLPELLHFADDIYRRFPNIAELTLIQLIPVASGAPALSEEFLEPEDFLRLVKTVSLLNLLGHRTRFLNNPLANVASELQKILWIPRSQPLYSEGRLLVMANRDICLSHSSRYRFGKYEPGCIGKVLDSDGYRQAVSPDEKTCLVCKYAALCMKYGMARPTEKYWEIISDVHFCQNVLNSAEDLLHESAPGI